MSETSSSRTAVVTGGGTGIGRAVARTLTAEGCRVAVLGRRQDVLEEVARETGAVAVAADLSRPSDVARAATEVVEALGSIDALVLNAGGSHRGPQDTLEQLAEHWMATMTQNLLPAVLLEHALRPHLRRPGGRVVATFAALDRAAAAYERLGNLAEVSVARGTPVGGGVRLQAENPVFVVWGPES